MTSAILDPFTGTKEEMKLLEKDFISGKYTPFAKDQGEVPKKTITKRPGPAQGDDSGASAKATSTAVKKPRKSTQPEPGKILCISSQSKWAVHVDDYTPQPLHVCAIVIKPF